MQVDSWVMKIPWKRHGNPLQYSCLENPMDRGAWRATVCRVAKSQKQLKRLSTHTHRKPLLMWIFKNVFSPLSTNDPLGCVWLFHFCYYDQHSLGSSFVHLEHFSRQRCGLTVVDSLGPSLCTSTARSSSTNTTNSILTNSRKGVCALKLLPRVKIVQIWWVKNVSLVLYGLHYFASEAELSSLLSAICSSELLLDFSFEWFIFYLLFVGIRYISWILILSICICCR